VGIDLQQHIKKGLLHVYSSRPTLNGLELHLLTLRKLIKEFHPTTVIIDPISNLINVGSEHEVRSMLVRLIDMLKLNNITALFTSLSKLNEFVRPDLAEESVSSLIDTWITVRDMEGVGERNRGIYIVKSRGMGHSNQVREFIITGKGIHLMNVEFGPTGILTGSARKSNEFNKRISELSLENELQRKDREIQRKRKILEATIDTLKNEFESVEEELSALKRSKQLQKSILTGSEAAKSKKKR
jgi:circadian clock protein KaiC